MTNSELFQVMESQAGADPWQGYAPARAYRSRIPNYESRLVEAIHILNNGSNDDFYKWASKVSEAITSGFLPLLYADVVDRQLLASYNDTPNDLLKVFRVNRSVPDFSTVYRNRVHGGDDRLEMVPELGEYTSVGISEEQFTYALKKWGRIFSFSWEAFLRDRQNVLTDQPNRFGRGAAKTLAWYLTNLLFDANGPRSSYFAGSGGQSAVSTLPFSPENLEVAYTEMVNRTGQGGDAGPIQVRPVYLWYSPYLELAVRKVLDSPILITGQDITIPNTNISSKLGLVPLSMTHLSQVVTDTPTAQQAWGLFTAQEDLPVGEVGFLTGRSAPELFIKSSNQQSVGGGDSSPLNGDFLTDRVDYKVRFCFGGTTMDPRAGWASFGHA